MIVVDTSFLVLLIDPDSTQNTDREADRVRHFIEVLSASKEEARYRLRPLQNWSREGWTESTRSLKPSEE